MLVGSTVRRVAIVGGSRIPVRPGPWRLRAASATRKCSPPRCAGVVEQYKLAGERLGDVIAGAVLKHSKDFNLVRECVLSSGLDPADSRARHPARLRHQPRGGHPGRQQDRARADRRRHRRGRRHHQRSARRVSARRIATCCCRAIAAARFIAAREAVARPATAPSQGRCMPGVIEPRTGLSMGQSCELMAKTWQHHARGAGRAGGAEPSSRPRPRGSCGFPRRSGRAVRGLKRDNNVRADTLASRNWRSCARCSTRAAPAR